MVRGLPCLPRSSARLDIILVHNYYYCTNSERVNIVELDETATRTR